MRKEDKTQTKLPSFNSHPIVSDGKGKDFLKRVRAMTIKKYDHILPYYCAECGIKEDLHIHHIKYDLPVKYKDIVRLCSKCHLLEHQRIIPKYLSNPLKKLKRVDKVFKGVEFTGKYAPRQTEILRLIIQEYLTIAQVARRLNISRTAVYKAIAKLENKGLYNKENGKIAGGVTDRGVGQGGVRNPYLNESNFPETNSLISETILTQNIRLHALHVVFKLRGNKRPKQNRHTIDGHTVLFYSEVADIYLYHSFYASSASECLQQSNEYLTRLLFKIENQTGAELYRDRNAAMTVKWHFAKTNDPYARGLNERKEKLQIKWRDGKVWLLADNSKPDGIGLNELETVHKDSAPSDMDNVVIPFFNGLKEHFEVFNEPFSPAVTSRLIGGMAKNAQFYNENIVSHVEAIKTLGSKVGELVDLVKELKRGTK